MPGVDSDSPPPYHAIEEESKTEENHFPATEITIPNYEDVPELYGVLFEHKDNRIGFIQKVILIKLFQVFAATIPLAVFVAEPYGVYHAMEYEYSTRTNLIVVSTLLLLGVLGLIHYMEEARVTRPYNYMFLLAYPLSIGFFVSVVTWECGLAVIFMSWVQFSIVLFGLLTYSIFALQSKIEFRTSIAVYIAAFIFIISYALLIPFIYINAFGVLYCCLALFALTGYMLYDIKVMMSRSYRLHLSPSDCVKAAVSMHVDYRYMIMKYLTTSCKAIFDDDTTALNDA